VPRVPVSWSIVPYKRLFDVQSGESFTDELMPIPNEGLFAVYGGNGLRGYSNKFSDEGIKVIIGRVGAKCGNIHLISGRYWVNENALKVVPKAVFNLNYIQWQLQAVNLNQYAITNAQPVLNSSLVLEQQVPLPPLDEQEKIANFLANRTGQIDHLITQKQQMLELLREERAALINHAVTKGPDAGGPMRDSGIVWIPDIPAHWDRVKLKALVSTKIADGPHETPEFLEEGVPFLSAEAIKDSKLDFTAKRGYISEEQHKLYIQKSRVLRNDILFCKSGSTTGKSAVVETDEDFGIWSPLAIIRANPTLVDYQFLFLCIQSYTFRNQVENFWSFGTQPNIGMGTLENLWVCLPPIEEQYTIVQHVKEHTQRIQEATEIEEKSITLLQEYRAALIAEAVTGQIDVREYVSVGQEVFA
jgi:restriction endonuclease S subunit